MTVSYACTEYPGMEGCPGKFTAATGEELWRHIQLHAELAHREDPKAWSEGERQQIRELIRDA